MASDNGKSFLDKFAEVSAKVGNQVHLRSLRDAFATITPLYILAGIAVLINNVVFPLFPLDAAGLANLQTWGSAITLGTLNVSAIILAGLIGYSLAKNKRFDNPLACVVVAISAFVIMMPQQITATLAATSPLLTDKITSAEVTGALSTANTGTNGLFSAIIIALLSVSLFIKISGVEKLKVKLGEGVPPAVSNSFNVMIPMLLNLAIFALAAALLAVCAGTDLCDIISTCISNPLKSIMNAGPWAVILIYTLANLLFCVGIHQSTISGATVEPILTMLIVDNMATFAAGGTIQPDHYMNMQIVNSFALIGGSGCTLMLLLDTLLFSKNKASETVSKMAILPGLFNINEPVIYGYPIVYNLPLMIPFVLLPDLFIGITYGLTCAGIISPCIAQVPWTMPPVINALLATGFDWRAGVWQALEIVIGMAVYLPFMKISRRQSPSRRLSPSRTPNVRPFHLCGRRYAVPVPAALSLA